MRWVAAVLALAACGRIEFDARSDAAPSDAIADATIGPACSDGERDGLADPAVFPRIAACAASWVDALSLRAPPTGAACGDDLGDCTVPADACGAGWHICSRSGLAAELLVLTDVQCASVAGKYVAASSHCVPAAVPACTYQASTALACEPGSGIGCAQPVCCGTDCHAGDCLDGVWPGATRHSAEFGHGCANALAAQLSGVLCCLD